MKNEKFVELAKEQFTNVCVSGTDVELQECTDGGVKITISLEIYDEENLLEQFQEIVNDFDIDQQIDTRRQEEDYRMAYTIRESLEDFESFEKWLNEVLENIESENIQ